MMVCKKLGYDGVAYYSKRVDEEKKGKDQVPWGVPVD